MATSAASPAASAAKAFPIRDSYEVGGVIYTVHPAANAFPVLPDSAFDDLVADVAANGLTFPIAVIGHEIIDGQTRLRACLAAGVEPAFNELAHSTDVWAYVATVNVHRRHLDGDQLLAIASYLLRQRDMYRKQRYDLRRQLRSGKAYALENALAAASPASADDSPASTPSPVPGAAVPAARAQAAGLVASDELLADMLQDDESSPMDVALASTVQPTSSDDLANALGVSTQKVEKVRALVSRAPDLEAPMRDGQLNLGDASKLVREPLDVRKAVIADLVSGRHPNFRAALAAHTAEPAKSPSRRAPKPQPASSSAPAPSSGLPPLPDVGGPGAAPAPAASAPLRRRAPRSRSSARCPTGPPSCTRRRPSSMAYG